MSIYEPVQDADNFRVAAGCPPDTRIYVRGGLSYAGPSTAAQAYGYFAWDVPDLTLDLAAEGLIVTQSDVSRTGIFFEGRCWYKGLALVLRVPNPPAAPTASDWKLHLFGSGDEFETARDAEQDLQRYISIYGVGRVALISDPYSRGMPLCGVIFRNDGRVGVAGAIQPIDPINRGRSYLWPPDLRHRYETGLVVIPNL